MAEVVIIGAGLTGLSTAYHLEQQKYADYAIFEKNERAGGLLRSVQQDGFTFDYTGHLLHISNPTFYDFLHSISNITNYHLVERKTGIFSHNVITDYPFQINLFGLPSNVAAECIMGYLHRTKHLHKPTNFYDWVRKYFGMGFGKHFFFPYNYKLLAYNLKKVHPSWTGRFVPSTNLEAIIKGTIEKKPASGIGYNSSFYYPKQQGIEFVIKCLQAQLKHHIKTEHLVDYIDPVKKIIYFSNGHQEPYRFLVTTIPLKQLLQKIKISSRVPFAQASNKLLCNAVVNINLGFSVDSLGSMHWLYFPEKAFPFYRLGFWHNICPNAVPQGKTAIYGEYSYLPGATGNKKNQKSTEDAINKILSFLGLQKHHIATMAILHLEHAYVIYDAWREKNVIKIIEQLKEMDIYSIGRYGEWKYSSMQEAFLDGKQTATILHKKVITKDKNMHLRYNVWQNSRQ